MNQKESGTASFEELLAGFLRFLQQEKSYKQSTMNNYRRRLNKISSFMQTHGIDSYTPDVGLKYYERYLAVHDLGLSFQKSILIAINRLNAFHSGEEYVVQHKHDIELLPENHEQELSAFEARCYEKGNKEITVKAKASFLRRFLTDCITLGCPSIQELNGAHVTRACLMVKDKDSWAVIRAFLKFLAVTGTVETDLSTLVPHHKQPFKVPVTYSVEEISKIESIIDRSTDIGKRDYAILLLASRLGLRSCDIVNITLDSLDFERGKLVLVQQKTDEALVLPLLPEIQEALGDYISNGRPETSERRVFIRQNAPYQGITTSVLRFETSRYFREAGIQITGKRHGPHTFRSSLASSMVNDAIPYEAVRKILGHSDPDAIRHYAKLDIEILRQCAIEVPEPSGNFKEFLQGGGSL
jgi:site-specific recombinase XerD